MDNLQLEGIYAIGAGLVGAIVWFIRLESSVKAAEVAIQNVKEDVVNTRKDFITAMQELKKDLDKMVTSQDGINKEQIQRLTAIEITLARVDGKLSSINSNLDLSKSSRS